jgi:phosphoglycerol transferase
VLAYAAAAAGAIVLAVTTLRLWRADLRVPFQYHSDGLAFALWVKSVVDNGWFLTTPQVGAPGVLAMHDFPIAEAFHMFLFRVMALVSGDWALLFNLYFLLGFPLITISALAVFRQFGVAFGPALVGSLLYAFLPSRLFKGEAHYFLDIFYQVPLVILVALWICSDDPPLVRRDGGPSRWPRLELRRRRTWIALAICALTSATGIYYAFFAAVLFVLGGLWSSIEHRTARPALAGVALTAVIVAGLGLQYVPIAAYHRRHGPNTQVGTREYAEAEVYGLRITQLLLPVTGHRVPALRRLKERYDSTAPFRGESSATSLGVVGSAGFLCLLALVVLSPRRARYGSGVLRRLAVLNLLAVLVATMGGFGSLFALLATPQIRGYSRMHVFIAFFSLFAVVVLVERAQRQRRLLGLVLPPLLLCVGLFDQVMPAAVRPYRELKAEYERDAEMVRQIERAVPAGAMIFELPYSPFPEAGLQPGQRRADYDSLRPYLHSRTLRWSYPTMLGRVEDAWVSDTAARPPSQLIARLSAAGFAGILVDRLGYRDNGAAIEAALASELGAPSIASGDRLIFFGLADHARRTEADLPAAERERRRDLALHPVLLRWRDGCYHAEVGPSGPFRWCTGAATLEIDNDAAVTQSAVLTFNAVAGAPPATLAIDGDAFSATLRLGGAGERLTRLLSLAPGHYVIRIRTDAAPVRAPNETRTLVWRAEDPRLETVPPR